MMLQRTLRRTLRRMCPGIPYDREKPEPQAPDALAAFYTWRAAAASGDWPTAAKAIEELEWWRDQQHRPQLRVVAELEDLED
jgi:hypothetical protein